MESEDIANSLRNKLLSSELASYCVTIKDSSSGNLFIVIATTASETTTIDNLIAEYEFQKAGPSELKLFWYKIIPHEYLKNSDIDIFNGKDKEAKKA